MQDKILFEILQGEIDTLQEQRKAYRRNEYLSDGVKAETDKTICIKIEAIEDLRTRLVAKGFFCE